VEATLSRRRVSGRVPSGYWEMSARGAEIHTFMADHPGAEVLDAKPPGTAHDSHGTSWSCSPDCGGGVFCEVHIHDPAHPCSNSCSHYTAPISDAPSATRRPSSAVWPMSTCRGDKATLVAPATLRYFVSGVGARYGVVLTSSHRSLRRRWHTLCEGHP
jgi:hypothetical protein